ncbi:alpha/beta fold hydrolase [Aquabacterium sp.]|uniref:alpha/beta fold hydrolase n=1 Tax=Aquabacterium sp. TaxID=1872578 RepID=UPI0035B2F2E4
MDIRPYVVEQGCGSPIVFVHGSFATTSTWKKMMERLAATHRCIAIKLPGHGGMPDPDDFDAPTLAPELNLIEAVARELVGHEPIHLVGHSYGGVVALAQALRGNLPLSELTLFEPVATWVLDVVNDTPMQAEVDAFVRRYRHDAAVGVPDVCGQVIDFWGGANDFANLPSHIQTLMGTMVKNNLRHWDTCTAPQHTEADLRALQVPTRLVCGTRSNQVAHAILNHLHRLVPHNRMWEIEGASHGLVASHADACLEALQSPV